MFIVIPAFENKRIGMISHKSWRHVSLMYFLQVVDIDQSAVSMFPTKLEVRLRKAEPGSWSKLDFPSPTAAEQSKPVETASMEELVPEIDAVDLSDL
mgnify:CR=1 FL=1